MELHDDPSRIFVELEAEKARIEDQLLPYRERAWKQLQTAFGVYNDHPLKSKVDVSAVDEKSTLWWIAFVTEEQFIAEATYRSDRWILPNSVYGVRRIEPVFFSEDVRLIREAFEKELKDTKERQIRGRLGSAERALNELRFDPPAHMSKEQVNQAIVDTQSHIRDTASSLDRYLRHR